ncbi:TonB-dependent receptor plug domain-containing protein [Sphingomonas sp. LY160]|uniref:TonB-dependent receptor plug domain-containing protein n=1 Tax=Sphingomonas sp. LY160 TaxID=3095342 RepID=UPI002ADEC6CF|nr:TonB-dependent receptor plug domain-containing protein [Sphingomonas sp. LY160]MEA1072310.1 TonB-dependent receptor plug domain-containing protein [Sphingomonas sp. LY160]
MNRLSPFALLLATTTPLAAHAQEVAPPPADTSEAAQPVVEEVVDDMAVEDEAEEVVVTGQRLRGSVIGDIPAENTLNTRDIRATGATSISELLDSVAAQTGSARGRSGGRPVLLLNGARISGFRELRDLPPEAIERMEILPEEVALKYGYAADQRVVNIVLRRRFNSTSVEARARTATEGGYVAGQLDGTRLTIRDGRRTSFNIRAEGNSALFEDERDIALQPILSLPTAVDPRSSRTLVGARQNVRLTGTANRTILEDVSATFTGEVSREAGRSRFGVPVGTLDDDGTEILRAFPGDPLTRRSVTDSGALGAAFNTQRGRWRLSSTANAELSRSTTRSDQGYDLSLAQARLDAGDPTFDPLGDLGPLDALDLNRARSVRRSLTADATANGPLLELPAGNATATFKVGASSVDLDSRATRAGIVTRSDLGRDSGEGSVNLDLPITRRDSPIGRLSANANAGLTQLSDFGTLTTYGGGLNWSPKNRLNLLTSFTREEGAPSLQQLGDPLLETPGNRFFDFTRGETVFVTTVTGGNPDLDADRRSVFKVGGNWQPKESLDLRLRAEYVRQTIDRPQASFPAATAALEAAFPDRFERDADGNLTRVDLRPVNFEKSRRDTFRWGFDFTKPLKSAAPSPAAIAALRQRFGAPGQRPGAANATGQPGAATPPTGAAPTPPAGEAGAAPPPAEGGGRRFGGPGGGGVGRFGGGRNGGRLTFSLTHTVNLVDRVTIADGLPDLDYLDGEAFGQSGGRPRHEVRVETGYFNNGLGARIEANVRSASRVDSGAGELRFSPYADVDLRLFANLGERFDLVAKHPWLAGTSVRFDVDNVFNARPKVRDAFGETPFSYQPGLIEPIGRTVGITIRKLFLPRRFIRRAAGAGRNAGS